MSEQIVDNIFGEVISSYTRAEAIDDGILVDVTEMAREAGFLFPVALTRAAWEDCVAWNQTDTDRQTHQDEAGRLWDVLWMAKHGARMGGREISFQLLRVPRSGRGTKPRLVTLKAVCGPGDTAAEPKQPRDRQTVCGAESGDLGRSIPRVDSWLGGQQACHEWRLVSSHGLLG